MVVNRKKLLVGLGFVMYCFFVFTVDFRTNIFRSVYIAYAFAIISLLMLFYGSRFRFKSKVSILVFLWGISIVFVFTSADFSLIIKYIIGLSLLYCYSSVNGAKEYTVYVLAVVGGIFTFFTFLFYFNPSIFVNSIVPHLEEYLQFTALTMIQTNRYPGLTGHYSTNGIYLAIGLGALFTVVVTHKKEKRFVWIFLTVLTLGALLLIGKRAHLVFSVASCFIVYWIIIGKQKQKRIVKIIGLLMILSVAFIIAVNMVPALGNTFNRFVETSDSGDFLMSRGIFYAEALKNFLANPVTGCGWRTLMGTIGHDAHNIYIQLLAETGIIGFVLYVGLILYGLSISLKSLKDTVSHSGCYTIHDKMMIYFATYYMLFFAIYGMTGNPLYDEQPFYIYMISYGVILYYSQIRKKPNVESVMLKY